MLETQDLEHILSHTRSLWNNLRCKRIFITGGTGFIGKWLLESFAKANVDLDLKSELHVLSRNPKPFQSEYTFLSEKQGIFYYQGDVQNFTFPEGRFDYIIHAATDADDHLIREHPLSTIDTIVNGTRRVLEFAQFSETRRVLYVSSGAVYGKQPADLTHIPENYAGAPDLSHPIVAYAESKRLAELLCSIYHQQHGLETITARCFALLGPYLPLDLHYAVGNFIQDGLKNRSIRLQGDGTALRSYLYAADLAIWLWTMLVLGKPGCAYNVGSDKEISILGLATKICEAFCGDKEVVVSKKAVPGTVPDRYIPDITLAKKDLGLDCRIDIDNAIRRTIDFHRKGDHSFQLGFN